MTRPKQRRGRGRTVLEPIPALRSISVTINGEDFDLNCKPARTLLEVLRDDLDLTGTKQGCDGGECGACTVLIEGEPRLACLTLAATLRGKRILTIEGLAKDGNLHPLQRAFLDRGAVQCGYCTPGVILCASALLNQNPAPTVEDVKKALAGNLCRCTGYQKIIDAVLEAGGRKRELHGLQ